MQWGESRIISENEIWGGSVPTEGLSVPEESISPEADWNKIRITFVFRLCKEGPSVSFGVLNPGVSQTLGQSKQDCVLWELGDRTLQLSQTIEKPCLAHRQILLYICLWSHLPGYM